MNFARTTFVRSAASTAQFISDGRPQVALAGRSNVGKSSMLNTLTRQNGLARVSSTPGKTAHVNYYLVDETIWLADLPGYGYARVGEDERRRWAALMESFFAQRGVISLGLLVVDIRHEPSALDQQMAGYFRDAGLRWSVVATKADKLEPKQLPGALDVIERALSLAPDARPTTFSSLKKAGRAELAAEIERRLAEPSGGA